MARYLFRRGVPLFPVEAAERPDCSAFFWDEDDDSESGEVCYSSFTLHRSSCCACLCSNEKDHRGCWSEEDSEGEEEAEEEAEEECDDYWPEPSAPMEYSHPLSMKRNIDDNGEDVDISSKQPFLSSEDISATVPSAPPSVAFFPIQGSKRHRDDDDEEEDTSSKRLAFSSEEISEEPVPSTSTGMSSELPLYLRFGQLLRDSESDED